MLRLRERLASHLGSRDVARVLYGAIVGLAVVVAFEDHPPDAGEAAVTMAATALAIGFAELYSEAVSAEARERRRLRRADVRRFARDAAAVVFGAGFPALFFLLAAIGLFTDHTAVVLSRWSGAGLIFGYGYLAARLAGFAVLPALVRGATVELVGLALIAIKALLH
jgi:hypothetical protein